MVWEQDPGAGNPSSAMGPLCDSWQAASGSVCQHPPSEGTKHERRHVGAVPRASAVTAGHSSSPKELSGKCSRPSENLFIWLNQE